MLKKDYALDNKVRMLQMLLKVCWCLVKVIVWLCNGSCHINNCRWYRNNFGNLKDIDMMTSQYAIDSDELFDNLNIIADKIKTGDDLCSKC
jgi:hypothetical protein